MVQKRKRVCRACHQGLEFDYKKPEVLRQFMNRRERILPRRFMNCLNTSGFL